ncbi:MAG: E3 binding domain-containing protein, partial [Pseudomonadales bacterium]
MDIKAPTFPESINEGTVAVWHKRPGDSVVRDDLLVDIETGKVVLEVVAPADGELTDILKDEGELVESEEVIARFEAGAPELPSAPPEPEVEEPAVATEVSASPAARKLADEEGIELGSLAGTGKAGRITKDDVSQAVGDQAGAPVAHETVQAAQEPLLPPALPGELV